MRCLRLALAPAALLLAGAVQAAPITFALDHGSVTARVQVGTTVIASSAGQLDAGFVVFDPSSGQIPDFSLQSSSLFIQAPALPGAYTALDLDILIEPGAGYSSSATGTGPWAVTLGPIDISFAGSVIDSVAPVTVPPIAVAGLLPVNSFGVTAYYNAGLMRLGLLGVKVGEIQFGSLVFDVRADIEFVGFAVPEPTIAGLLAAAFGGLAWLGRRRPAPPALHET
jgi:hypothetical protein